MTRPARPIFSDRDIDRLDRENDDAFVVSLALNQLARQQVVPELPPLASLTLVQVLTLRAVCATDRDVMWFLGWPSLRVRCALAAGVDTGEIEMVELPGYDVPLFRTTALSSAHPAPRGTPWTDARLSDDAEMFKFTVDGRCSPGADYSLLGVRRLVIDGSSPETREQRAWWEVGQLFDGDEIALFSRQPFGLEFLPRRSRD